MLSSFGKFSGKTAKIKQFSFTPRYYDEDKERLKDRYAQIEAELKGKSGFRSSASGNLRDRWQRNKKTSNFEKKSNVRLVFIITILVALCYWLLYY